MECHGPACEHEALLNGYCPGHQDVAIVDVNNILVQLIIHFEKLLNRNKRNYFSEPQIKNIIQYIKTTVTSFKDRNVLCDVECMQAVRDILASTNVILMPGGEIVRVPNDHPAVVIGKLATALRTLVFNCPKNSLTEVAEHSIQARGILGKQIEDNNARIARIQQALQQTQEMHKQKDQLLNAQAAQIARESGVAQRQSEQYDKTVLALQNKISQCATAENQIQAASGEVISKLQHKIKTHEDNSKRLMKDRLITDKRLASMETELMKAKAAHATLLKSYKKAQKQLTDKFAQATKGSELQKQLYHELKVKEEQLQKMAEQMESFKNLYNEAMQSIDRLGNTMTSESSAKQFEDTAQRLVEAQEQLNQSRTESAKLRQQLAEKERSFVRRVAEAIRKHKTTSASSQEELMKEREMHTMKQRELVNLKRDYDKHMFKHGRLMEKMQAEVLAHRRKAERATQQAARADRLLRERMTELEQKFNTKTNAREIQLQDLEDSLKRKYAEQDRILRTRMAQMEQQLNGERERMAISMRQHEREKALLAESQAEMLKKQEAFSKQFDRFTMERAQLEDKLRQAESQLKMYRDQEQKMERRLSLLNRTITNERVTTQKQVEQLRLQVAQLQKSNLEKENMIARHKAEQAAATNRVRQLEIQNKQLEHQTKTLIDQKKIMESRYQVHLAKLRADAQKAQDDANAIRLKLQETSDVHMHMKQMEQQMKALKRQTEREASIARDHNAAYQRLVNQTVADDKEKKRLMAAVQRAEAMVTKLNQDKQVLNEQIMDLKSMAQEYDNEMKNQATLLNETITRGQADRAREMRRNKAEQDRLKRERDRKLLQLNSERARNTRLAKRVQSRDEALMFQQLQGAQVLSSLLDEEKSNS